MFFIKKNRMTPARIILIGFALLILAGALLLTLPISTRDGRGASFFDALFTATSATCVTGLVVQDTSLYWSGFGQADAARHAGQSASERLCLEKRTFYD